jgi:hypothetical protein
MKMPQKMLYVSLLCLGCIFSGCRNEEEAEKERISSIEFEVERVDVNVNEDFIVRVIAKSDEGKKNEKIRYTSINEGFIQIREPSNDGFVVKGLKAGSTVIRVQSQYVDRMLEVKVYGEDILARYIKLDKPVIEVYEGSQVQTFVTLYGKVTEPDDNSLFQWQLEAGKNNIAVNFTGNIAVIRGIERGYQEINVRHPRAGFDNKILVFVKGVDEEVKYIYRDSNILVMPNDGNFHDFDVVLINGVPSDAVDFSYEVTDGNQNIQEISKSQNKCNVMAAKSGLSTIRVSHPLAKVDFDVRVVIYDLAVPYIMLDQTFLLLNAQESGRVTAEVENARNGVLHKNQFSYVIIENGAEVPDERSIIEVVKTNESFYIRAKRAGTARIVISNEQAHTPREVLVVVRDEAAYRDDYYITTEQNVITTQVGADMTRLYARLINGVSADANNFIWDVDDITVVNLRTNHGNVRYGNSSRAMVNGPANVFEAYADIEPLKTGTAKITITNTKWPDTLAQVIVRVYPKGTFVNPPVRVGYDGLIKLEYGKPDTTVALRITDGSAPAGDNWLDWEIENSSIAELPYSNAHGLVNILRAAAGAGGITKLKVKNMSGLETLEFPHESLVIAGNADYINSISVIYADNIYQKVLEQQTIDVHILNSKTNSQGLPDESWYPYGFEIFEVSDPAKVYAVMVKNVLKIMGKERGQTNIKIRHNQAVNEFITIHVQVEPANLSIEQPYYISGPEIKGVVRTVPADISVSLMPNAPESEVQKLIWTSTAPAVVSVNGTGSQALLIGRINGGQEFITVGHKNNKAQEKQILVYVVESAADLNKVVLGTKQQTNLLKTGHEQLITIITNASDEQKRHISWKVATRPGDPAPVTIDPHYDSAMIRAVAAGNAMVEVTYTDYANHDHRENGTCTGLTGKETLPLSIYVSVVDGLSDEKVIKGPAVIEIIRGEGKIISVQQLNLTQNDLMKIKWAVETEANEEPLANIEGNGDSAYIYGLRRGVGKVKIWQEDLGYTHYATLVCADSAVELENLYVMGVDASYQKMMLGEEKKVRLTFGSNGFPEAAKRSLKWEADGTGKVKVIGSPGESVSIIAQEPGEAEVTVTDINNPAVSFNETLKMKFLVIDPHNSSIEFRDYQKMVGIVVGQNRQVNLRLYDNENEIKNYHLWSDPAEISNPGVASVNIADGDPSGKTLDIRALSIGETYVTMRYNNEVSARILVYTALTADDLENYYPILVEKTNYLLQIGQSETVRIETMTDRDAANFSKVSWGIEGANFIEKVDTAGKKEFTIKGKSAGNCVISVNYTDKGKTETKARIFVTVVSNEEIDTTKYIITENIIGMQAGTQFSTRIFHNLGSGVSDVVWESLTPSIVTVSGRGEEATLRAAAAGEAYVTVSYGSWLKRYIRVYVKAAGSDIGDYRAMNIENQYYRTGIGETFTLPVYFAPIKSSVPTLWIDKYENKVVRFERLENGSKVDITALSEGVAVLEAVNTGLNDPSHVLRIYIEVSKKYNGAPRPIVDRFLTISKTIYVMNPDNRDEELNLRVQGVGYTVEELERVTWQLADDGGKSGSLISIYPNGQECRVRVNPVGKEGTAEIRASKTENEVLIRVVVTRTGLIGYPSIVGEETVRVGLGQKVSIVYDVAEAGSYDLNNFYALVVGSGSTNVSAKFNKNVLEIEGKMSGQALLRITCEPTVSTAHYKDVMVIVTTTLDGLVYLTTRDNFTQVKIGETKTVSVDLAGLSNPGESGYIWSIAEEDRKYLKMSPNGRQATFEGLEAGAGQTVKVTVRNTIVNDLFALTMWVRISDNFFNTMYLTTTQNVVSVTEGRSMYLTAELINGAQGEEQMISWRCLDTEFAQVMGTGPQAYVLGNHLGFARVVAEYSKAVNKQIEILVVIEKDTTSDGIYLTSTDGLVTMKPGDTRKISVRLVGGGVGDEYGFSWNDNYVQNPVIAGKKVAEIYGSVTGVDNVIIRALNEGEATIRVTHRRSSYILDLKIYVQEYSKVEFDSEVLTINSGEEKIVRVTMPSNTSVRYVVDKPNVISLSDVGPTSSGFLVITGLPISQPTTVKITAALVEKPYTDEMLVTVNPVNNKLVQYIQTNDTIFNMVDWQSASNRAMVSGLPVGEKLGGGKFNEMDSLGLQWNITSGSQFAVFDLPTNAEKTRTVGKTVSIASIKPGTAEIEVTHPEMPGYYKKVYVNITPYDANFILSPAFQSLQIGDQAAFSVGITGNVDETAYKNLTWRLLSNENNEYGVEFIERKFINDTLYEKAGEDGMKSVRVLAVKAGVYKLKAVYEGRELETIIYVEKAKVLEIYDESFVKMVPGSTVFIGLYHEPLKTGRIGGIPKEDVWIQYNNEWHQFAEVGYCGPVKELVDGKMVLNTDFLPERGMYYGDYNEEHYYQIRSAFNKTAQDSLVEKGFGEYNALLVVHGTELEGFTKITVKYNNIERVVTVHNSRDYGFNMIGVVDKETNAVKKASVVRGQPGQVITVKYEVMPAGSEIKNGNFIPIQDTDEYFEGNGYPYYEGRSQLNIDTGKIIDNISFDFIKQEITFRLVSCGYTELKFRNELYDDQSKQLVIPVYIYYEKMVLDWKANNKTSGTRMDGLANAIYIANNETLNIYLEKEPQMIGGRSNPYAMSIKGYEGDDLELVSIRFSNGGYSEIKNTFSNSPLTANNYVTCRQNANNPEMARAGIYARSENVNEYNNNILGFAVRGNMGDSGTAILRKVEYLGVLEIVYKYSNGGAKRAEFTKRFLLYGETWGEK